MGDTSADFRMPRDIINCARSRGPSNFLVIAKQSTELHRVLKCLQSRNNTVLVVVDNSAAQESPFHSVQSLVDCTQFLGGGKPISKPRRPHNSDSDDDYSDYSDADHSDADHSDADTDCDNEEDASSQFHLPSRKMEDFSERITPPRTAVYWDVVDCPFPPCPDPDHIYLTIARALSDRGFSSGDMSVWAYGDLNSINPDWRVEKKAWETRINFLPGGDKHSRPNRMLHDILLWEMDIMYSPVRLPRPANLIVVSDKFREDAFFFHRLKHFSHSFYDVVLVTPPPPHGNKPESSEWPGLLLDDAYVFPEWPGMKGSERFPKKHKLEA